MATGIKERLEGRMPRQQVTECAKQYVLNWHVLQKYGIPLESIPVEYTVMYIPFSERYRYHILVGSILGAVFVLTVIVLLSFSLLHERRRKREALRNLLYEHETLCLAIEGNFYLRLATGGRFRVLRLAVLRAYSPPLRSSSAQ